MKSGMDGFSNGAGIAVGKEGEKERQWSRNGDKVGTGMV